MHGKGKTMKMMEGTYYFQKFLTVGLKRVTSVGFPDVLTRFLIVLYSVRIGVHFRR